MKRISFNNNWTVYSNHNKIKSTVTLPHDAMILENRDANAPSASAGGFFPGGVYTYEKSFDIPEDWNSKHIEFLFEGVYQNAKVYINGNESGGRPYGYIPFMISADQYLKYGDTNTIKVIADNSLQPNSRWYTGSGIYRPVWMYVGEKEHIQLFGVKIKTKSISPTIIEITTKHTGKNVSVEILDRGTVIASTTGDITQIQLDDASLWSDENPHLYHCRVRLLNDGSIVDEVIESFGIRHIEWSVKGLFVNGKETLLRGGCIHHDNGLLGAKTYRETEFRKVRILKETGYNAIRVSHNPATNDLLDACDYYGMYVMDETWDMWYHPKHPGDYAVRFLEHFKEDIETMVNRDYNHPCVIMYSLGNEISEPATAKGVELLKEMVIYTKSLDSSRPISAGMNMFILFLASKGKGIYKQEGGRSIEENKKQPGKSGSLLFNTITAVAGSILSIISNMKSADLASSPGLDVLDIAGYNYASGRYKKDGHLHPNRIIVGTETFPKNIAKNWKNVKKYPYLIGDFMWTAWDYLGEAGMGSWTTEKSGNFFEKDFPHLLAEGGAIDILGYQRTEAEYAATVWGLRKYPYIAVRPVIYSRKKVRKAVWRWTNAIESWSWSGCENEKAVIEVYSDAHSIKLLRNGKKVGKKTIHNNKALFKTVYKPGELVAIGFDKSGNELSRSSLSSASNNLSIHVIPETPKPLIDEILYVKITIADENGIIESNHDIDLQIHVEGGNLLGFGSASPKPFEPYYTNKTITYFGMAQAIIHVQSWDFINIKVESSELPPTTLRLVF